MDELSRYKADRLAEFQSRLALVTTTVHHFELRGQIMPMSPGFWKIFAVLSNGEEVLLTEGDFLPRGWYGAHQACFLDWVKDQVARSEHVIDVFDPY